MTCRAPVTQALETTMRLSIKLAFLLLFVPLVASAQFRDLDVAMSNLKRGFSSGDPQAIVAGMASGDKVMLQFPGLIEQSGFFGRDQAAYLLDGLFNKVKPTAFEAAEARRRVSAEAAVPHHRHLDDPERRQGGDARAVHHAAAEGRQLVGGLDPVGGKVNWSVV